MLQENKRSPLDRLVYSGSIEPVIDRLSNAYGIGTPRSFSTIGLGYEDCNVLIGTGRGKYVAKIFEKGRTPEDIAHYGSMMEKVMDTGVAHPRVLRTQNGSIVYSDPQANSISLILMEFIQGETYFELDRAPTSKELQKIAEQAAKINRIDYRPPRVVDSWSIPNIHEMFERVRQFIQLKDLGLVQEAVRRYDQMPNGLTKAFVHGDFTKGNIIKADNGDIYILDFSVAFRYPRIQELAVIAASLMHDGKNYVPLRGRAESIAQAYGSFNPLTSEEHEHLYDYALADYATKFMGSHQEKYINGNDTPENRSWFNLGRQGLSHELT